MSIVIIPQFYKVLLETMEIWFCELPSWQFSLRKINWVAKRGLFSADVSVTTTWGQVCPPPAPRNIWQLCRKISVTLNPPPAPGPSCPCAAMSWEPLWVFASPQDSRYKVKDRFLLLKFPSLHVMWLGIGERAGSLLRDPHQPPASTVSN